jgi:hypothetical protein
MKKKKHNPLVDADVFDSVLKRLIEHKPMPKKALSKVIKTKREKLGK